MINTFKYLLIFAFLSPLNLLAQSLIPVENHYFEKGNYWVWEYKNHKGEHNSFEKYEVEKRSGSVITILMQSQLQGETEFKTHHKMVVDLEHCHNVYKDYRKLSSWQLRGFYFNSKNGWVRVGNGSNVQAFEEKFSCHRFIDVNGFQFKHSLEEGFVEAIGELTFSINKKVYPKPGQFDSKYVFQPYELGGIAAYKVFNPGKGKDQYTFELVDWKM